jgi:predicted RNase H-like HicB family nuclease
MVFTRKLTTAEGGWIVAECPALPGSGCVSQGKDQQEALANRKEPISAWLWAEDQKDSPKCQCRRARDPGNRVVSWRGWQTFAATSQSRLLKKPVGNKYAVKPRSRNAGMTLQALWDQWLAVGRGLGELWNGPVRRD